jgi:hypothetical protein
MTSLSFRTSANSGSTDQSVSSVTFTSMDIGTASSTRYVVFGIAGRDASATVTAFSSVTLAGTNMTSLVQQFDSGSFAGLFILNVTTGTTADIVVTWNHTVSRWAGATWACYDLLSATPRATNSSTSSGTSTLDVNTIANGIIIDIGFANATAASISGVTQDFINTANTGSIEIGGSKQVTTLGTPTATSITWTSGSVGASVSVSLDPIATFAWFTGLTDPPRARPGIAAALAPFFFYSPLPPLPSFGWFQALSEPRRERSGLKPAAQQAIAYVPNPLTVTPFAWFEPLSEPARTRPGLRAALQQSFTSDPTVIPVSRMMPWFSALSEPSVKTRQGLAPSLQQAWVGPARLLPKPNLFGTLKVLENKDVFLGGFRKWDRINSGEVGLFSVAPTMEIAMAEQKQISGETGVKEEGISPAPGTPVSGSTKASISIRTR